MKTFHYSVVETSGKRRTGSLEAASLVQAIETLEQSGDQILSIEQSSDVPPGDLRAQRNTDDGHSSHEELPDKSVDVQVATPQCDVLVERTVENVSGWLAFLNHLASSWPDRLLAREVNGIDRDLRGFTTNDPATGMRCGKHLVRVLPYAIRDDDKSLEVWARAVELTSRRSGRLLRVLAYPVLMGMAAIGVCLWLAYFVLPIFEDMFTEFGISLPPPTKFLLAASEMIRKYIWLLSAAAGFFTIIVFGIARLSVKHAIPTRLFGAWFTGTASILSATSDFTMCLAELLDKNVSLGDALQFSGNHCRHAMIRSDALRLANRIASGERVADIGNDCEFIPPTVVAALRAKNGKPSVTLLRSIADVYSRQSDSTASVVEIVLPPIGIACIGVFVAFVLLALFSPMFRMITSLA